MLLDNKILKIEINLKINQWRSTKCIKTENTIYWQKWPMLKISVAGLQSSKAMILWSYGFLPSGFKKLARKRGGSPAVKLKLISQYHPSTGAGINDF